MDHLFEYMRNITGKGGEGVILKKPKSHYARGRISPILESMVLHIYRYNLVLLRNSGSYYYYYFYHQVDYESEAIVIGGTGVENEFRGRGYIPFLVPFDQIANIILSSNMYYSYHLFLSISILAICIRLDGGEFSIKALRRTLPSGKEAPLIPSIGTVITYRCTDFIHQKKNIKIPADPILKVNNTILISISIPNSSYSSSFALSLLYYHSSHSRMFTWI